MSVRQLLRPSWRTLSKLSSGRSMSRHAPPFPTTPSCPAATCTCAPMPEFPEGLEIDHSKPLNGTMAPYAEQLLVCTGQPDWLSRVEEENGGDNLVADVKELIGRGGIYSDPYHNTPLTNSSFQPTTPPPYLRDVPTTSAYLLPSFTYVPLIPRSFDAVQALVKGYLLPTKLNPAHEALSPIHQDRLKRSEAYQAFLPPAQEVDDILVLVCGHGGRDMRCGVLGPVLVKEFEEALPRAGVEVRDGPVPLATPSKPPHEAISGSGASEAGEEPGMSARVGLISHIGGHKFAGNVILYIPPSARLKGGEPHPLRGMGIWGGESSSRLV
ncbi:hypothetical protein V494_05141 [Pseudogymnoascus sp. VKM F-4513 (FW-928)]|nr:hypothetical protein V494_05141 [Pseudogymnoascus sp. VKM F-4513 (FW-928)]